MVLFSKKLDECSAEVGLDERERDLVATWREVLDSEIAPMAERYYGHLKTTDVGRLLTPERVDQLLAARIAHWRLLVRGDFPALAEDYQERIGRSLFDAGFPMRIFVVAAGWFAVELSRFVDRSPDIPDAVRGDLRIALMKYAALDLALAHASREVAYLD